MIDRSVKWVSFNASIYALFLDDEEFFLCNNFVETSFLNSCKITLRCRYAAGGIRRHWLRVCGQIGLLNVV